MREGVVAMSALIVWGVDATSVDEPDCGEEFAGGVAS